MLTLLTIENCGQNFHGAKLTIGNFDGLHLGHQELFKRLEPGLGPTVVMTFEPHPLQVLHPERKLSRLLPREDLAEQLPKYGVDVLLVLPFTTAFAQMPAKEFLRKYVEVPLKPSRVVAGYDFAFGQGREGSLEMLKDWGSQHHVDVQVLEPFRLNGQTVSSRVVREMVLQGDVLKASELLKRPFYLRGPVVPGAGRGRGIGIPTLNQSPVNEILPKLGVYASRIQWKGLRLDSVTNIGVNPTFADDQKLKVETHILAPGTNPIPDTSDQIDVQLIDRIRDEMKFPDAASLVQQIQADIARAKAILKSLP
jgi:riboflavin kinase/FMN adenylyltransferase